PLLHVRGHGRQRSARRRRRPLPVDPPPVLHRSAAGDRGRAPHDHELGGPGRRPPRAGWAAVPDQGRGAGADRPARRGLPVVRAAHQAPGPVRVLSTPTPRQAGTRDRSPSAPSAPPGRSAGREARAHVLDAGAERADSGIVAPRMAGRGTDVAAPLTVLYIAGAGRSATTLVGNILNQVEGCFCAGELRHLWREGAPRSGAPAGACGCGRCLPDCPVWSRVLATEIDPGVTVSSVAASAIAWQRSYLRVRHA